MFCCEIVEVANNYLLGNIALNIGPLFGHGVPSVAVNLHIEIIGIKQVLPNLPKDARYQNASRWTGCVQTELGINSRTGGSISCSTSGAIHDRLRELGTKKGVCQQNISFKGRIIWGSSPIVVIGID